MQNTSRKWRDGFCTAVTQPHVAFEIVALTNGLEEAIQLQAMDFSNEFASLCMFKKLCGRMCGNSPATAMRRCAVRSMGWRNRHCIVPQGGGFGSFIKSPAIS